MDNGSLGRQERGQESVAGRVTVGMGWEGDVAPAPPIPPFLAHLLTAPQLLLSRYMGLDCRADRMARREEKFRSSLQRWAWGGGAGQTPSLTPRRDPPFIS